MDTVFSCGSRSLHSDVRAPSIAVAETLYDSGERTITSFGYLKAAVSNEFHEQDAHTQTKESASPMRIAKGHNNPMH